MKKYVVSVLVLLAGFTAQAQGLQRPKLVVGVVVDQMRWDYLYRYYDRYAEKGGFKRLLNQGFSCDNTMINYTPAVTACGHSSIYTGSAPSITGITGNTWWDYDRNREMYCVEDKSVKTVGSNSLLGLMSPKNLLTTTIGDELRLATNFNGKVIGVAIKDRGGILPAGQGANGAYWYDNTTGSWITSTYYMNELPAWAKDFNAKKMVDQYYQQGWNTLYPVNTYTASDVDDKPYEMKPLGGHSFPYDTKAFIGKNYGVIASMPQGNTFTLEMAKAAIAGEKLGADNITDLLAISLSSPDYIGHAYGPNSVEQEDDFLRLDKDLGNFLDYLDSAIGKNQYLLFLSADHGVAHIPGFLNEHHIAASNSDLPTLAGQLGDQLMTKFGKENLVNGIYNTQVFLNRGLIDSLGLNIEDIKNFCIKFLSTQPNIARVFAIDKLGAAALNPKVKDMVANGYYPKRCGDVQIILQPQVLDGFLTGGTTHGLWNPYDTHIPLLFYGWNIKPGKSNKEVYITDITPTLSALLHIQMPNGCIGKPIEDVLK
jgi:predicted AlkP superfamily pyrophosphatase or phosphodiesterase